MLKSCPRPGILTGSSPARSICRLCQQPLLMLQTIMKPPPALQKPLLLILFSFNASFSIVDGFIALAWIRPNTEKIAVKKKWAYLTFYIFSSYSHKSYSQREKLHEILFKVIFWR